MSRVSCSNCADPQPQVDVEGRYRSHESVSNTAPIAPGRRILVHDYAWLVRRVDRTSTGRQGCSAVGVSEPIREKEAVFLEDLETPRGSRSGEDQDRLRPVELIRDIDIQGLLSAKAIAQARTFMSLECAEVAEKNNAKLDALEVLKRKQVRQLDLSCEATGAKTGDKKDAARRRIHRIFEDLLDWVDRNDHADLHLEQGRRRDRLSSAGHAPVRWPRHLRRVHRRSDVNDPFANRQELMEKLGS